jgi:hypothetical protein
MRPSRVLASATFPGEVPNHEAAWGLYFAYYKLQSLPSALVDQGDVSGKSKDAAGTVKRGTVAGRSWQGTISVRLIMQNRKLALVISLVVAGVLLRAIVTGNYCLVPSFRPGEVGTAETSIFGFALYLEAGTEHEAMYHRAVWWYEALLLAEWASAVVVGAAVYAALRRFRSS